MGPWGSLCGLAACSVVKPAVWEPTQRLLASPRDMICAQTSLPVKSAVLVGQQRSSTLLLAVRTAGIRQTLQGVWLNHTGVSGQAALSLLCLWDRPAVLLLCLGRGPSAVCKVSVGSGCRDWEGGQCWVWPIFALGCRPKQSTGAGWALGYGSGSVPQAHLVPPPEEPVWVTLI